MTQAAIDRALREGKVIRSGGAVHLKGPALDKFRALLDSTLEEKEKEGKLTLIKNLPPACAPRTILFSDQDIAFYVRSVPPPFSLDASFYPTNNPYFTQTIYHYLKSLEDRAREGVPIDC